VRAGAGSGRRAAGRVAVAALLLLLSACAAHAGGATGASGATASPTTPVASDQLVLQVRYVGGFLPVGVTYANPPIVSVYADGRVITEGAVPAVYPRPALPDLRLQRISADDVRTLIDRALAAGVRDGADLGRPPVMDAATTRFTVVDGDHTYVRDVYALMETARGGGVGPGYLGPAVPGPQQSARQRLLGLYQALTDLEGTLGTGHVTDAGAYVADNVAAVVTTAKPQPGDPRQPPRPWPGPPLPGEPFANQAGVTCLTTTGAEATTLLQAAGQANLLTPWTGADGQQWWVSFRPLLPHETGCADLAG
jgi:hypothetical protein